MPRVSILLTSYNHLAYLPRCLEGVLAQTMGDWEILAIDDGSKDGSRDWLRKHADERWRLFFNEKNLGTYGALNLGVQESRGEFVAILNDDDVWLPEKLELQIAMFERDPKMGLVHTAGWFIDENEQRVEGEPVGFPYPRTGTGDVLHELLRQNRVINSSALVRKSVFDEIGPFDAAFYGMGDWQMWLRVARDYHVGYVEEPCTLYRVHGANACLDTPKMDLDGMRVREFLAGWEEELSERMTQNPDLKTEFAFSLAALGAGRQISGDRAGAREALVRSLRLDPKPKPLARLAATYVPGLFPKR